MTGTPGRLPTLEEVTSVKNADLSVRIAQDNLQELLNDRAMLWTRLIDDNVQPTAIAHVTGKTRGAIIGAVFIRRQK